MADYYEVFLGSANSFVVRLFNDYAPADLSSVTRITLKIDTLLIDSEDFPNAIEWDVPSLDTGEIRISLGTVVGEAMDYTGAFLTLYDPGTPEGLTWANSCDDPSFFIRFCDELLGE